MTARERVVCATIELFTGVSGFVVLWQAAGWKIALAVFLLTWSAYCHFALTQPRVS